MGIGPGFALEGDLVLGVNYVGQGRRQSLKTKNGANHISAKPKVEPPSPKQGLAPIEPATRLISATRT
jgi:hypothetical protein